MLRYTISRLLQAVLVILVMSLLLFMLIGLMPGDPVENMLEGNPSLTPETMAQMRALYGLDQPVYIRYGHWLYSALHGDLGYSSVYFRPVLEVLGPAIVQTAKLLVATEIISIPLAMLLGALAARRPGGWTDSLISLFAFASISLPGFWTSLHPHHRVLGQTGMAPRQRHAADGRCFVERADRPYDPAGNGPDILSCRPAGALRPRVDDRDAEFRFRPNGTREGSV